MAQRSSKTLPNSMRTSSFDARVPHKPRQKEKKSGTDHKSPEDKIFLDAPIYLSMQNLVQKMLHSETGVPIRSHKKRLISAIPSAFTGADIVNWLTKNLAIQSKVEAVHLANLICKHGYFFCVESVSIHVKDDSTLFRFQTPYFWPSQKPNVSDFEYGVYLVKQVLRSKHRIRLLDYELNNLHKLKLRLAKEWKPITERAEDDVRVFREQKRIAKAIMSSQEEAFWRLHRPPPGESSVQDSALTRQCTERLGHNPEEWTEDGLKNELALLKESTRRTRVKVSTAVDNMWNYCQRYKEQDPMMVPPLPSNPWVTGDTTLWTVEKSLIEYPSERHVQKWACSFHDLLTDVTGRFKFERYCKSQFNLENVRFWQSCRDLKSLPLMAITGSVQLVYDEFLQHGAVSEVNVSANVQEEVERDLKNPSRYAFCTAQEQIYKLMQNDIYPRFLKSTEYRDLLRRGREVEDVGKGFFSKLQRKKFESVRQDASGISPCLPQRYTRRQLSISHKMGAIGGSSSLDDIFLACSSSLANTQGAEEAKRLSTYTEAFIDALVSPNPDNILGTDVRQRRVSAPDPSLLEGHSHKNKDHLLDNIHEDQIAPIEYELKGQHGMEMCMPMSYSADDLQQLMEDADSIGPSKWKKFGIAAGIDFKEPLCCSDAPRRSFSQTTDQSRNILNSPLLLVPPMKLEDSGANLLHVSNESIQSATSH